MLPPVLDLASLRALYAAATFSPTSMADALFERMTASRDPAIFISPMDRDGLRLQAGKLLDRAPEPNSLPLWGIPFAVKDNIDFAGLPTTAGCPSFAYTPERDAAVVARLKTAGAILTGKTNLDQFATGLNGTRSPYGAPRCVFDPAFISGGSSSGSAVAVAAGLASFALGTDTAGSGRVPAAFNNIVGIKPTPGRISGSGLVPACRSIDVVTVFAACVSDGVAVRRVADGFDPDDPFSRFGSAPALPTRPRVGVLRPQDRQFFGDQAAAALYQAAIDNLATCGAEAVFFEYAPFREAAVLLYDGPWVAERLAALETPLATYPESFDPAVRGIVESARRFSAVDAFRGRYQLEELRRLTETTWATCDALMLPTAPTIYTVEAMRADPIRLNSQLGVYTNFANLLGLAAIAVPAGFRPDGLPLGVTLVGPAWSDDALAPLADALHRACSSGMGRPRAEIGAALEIIEQHRMELAVCGAHLEGLPLNGELLALGARFVRSARTTGDYRLFALPGTSPPKPGLVRDTASATGGILVELWSLLPEAFGAFVSAIPSPLGIGRISLEDGSTSQGFLCERWAVDGATDISSFGGWRAYLEQAAQSESS